MTASASWCGRAGSDLFAQSSAMIQIAHAYRESVGADCQSRGLTEPMTALQARLWEDYLFDYGSALAGCALRHILPGGVEAFGPGNTAVVGVSHAALMRADVDVLIRLYMGVFAPPLALSTEESMEVEDLLWKAAEPIDPTASAILVRCEGAATRP